MAMAPPGPHHPPQLGHGHRQIAQVAHAEREKAASKAPSR
jgi:hypothetical protein